MGVWQPTCTWDAKAGSGGRGEPMSSGKHTLNHCGNSWLKCVDNQHNIDVIKKRGGKTSKTRWVRDTCWGLYSNSSSTHMTRYSPHRCFWSSRNYKDGYVPNDWRLGTRARGARRQWIVYPETIGAKCKIHENNMSRKNVESYLQHVGLSGNAVYRYTVQMVILMAKWWLTTGFTGFRGTLFSEKRMQRRKAMAPRQRRKELDLGSLGVLRGMRGRGGESNNVSYHKSTYIYIHIKYDICI